MESKETLKAPREWPIRAIIRTRPVQNYPGDVWVDLECGHGYIAKKTSDLATSQETHCIGCRLAQGPII